MSATFNPDSSNAILLKREAIAEKLKGLKEADKESHWICYDLKVVKSNPLTRLIWIIVTRLFPCLRKLIFNVDLNASKKNLENLRAHIINEKDPRLLSLFNEAAAKFNQIAPNHQVNAIARAPLPKAEEEITFGEGNEKAPHPPSATQGANANNVQRDPLLDNLLIQAFNDYNPSLAALQVSRGASPSVLETLAATPKQKELYDWLNALSQEKTASPENLDWFALVLKGGYKFANLKVLQEASKKVSKELKHCTLSVPPFLSVSDLEVRAYLEKEIPILFTLWKEFLETLKGEGKESAISEDGAIILQKIRAAISFCFMRAPFTTPQIEEWLKKENPTLIIARSCGKEDSDTNANAGGNESSPYVPPEEKKISFAIGKVIGSYFSEKSIMQRLAAKDETLFQEEIPFLPVMLQVMIHEPSEGKEPASEDIPRSGVIFTGQPGKAKGVSFIQAGLGSNEGIVTGKVAADTFFIQGSRIHAVIRNKESRIAGVKQPDKSFVTEIIKNQSLALQTGSALQQPVLHDLKRLSDSISALYGSKPGQVKPMEMEFTVMPGKDGQKPTVHLLQARPLVFPLHADKEPPSYLDFIELNNMDSSRKIPIHVVAAENTHVRAIKNPNQIILEEDLEKGLHCYLAKEKAESIQAVITRKPSLAASHEAVSLSTYGIAVASVNGDKEFLWLKKALKSASQDTPLLLDFQRGIAAVPDGGADLKAIIRQGEISYPVPLELTIPPSKLMKIYEEKPEIGQQLIESFNQEISDLISSLEKAEDEKAGKPQDPIDLSCCSLRDLLDLMSTAEKTLAKKALARTLLLMKSSLSKKMKEGGKFRGKENKCLFQVFEAAVDIAKKEIIPAFEHPPQSKERLFPIKFLDAMVFQDPSKEILDSYSYAMALALTSWKNLALKEAESLGIHLKGKHADELLHLFQMSKASFSEGCKENWASFVKGISLLAEEEMTDALQAVKEILGEMDKLNLAPLWLNTVFHNTWERAQGVGNEGLKHTLDSLKKAAKDDKMTLQWIAKRQFALEGLEKLVPKWSDPSFVENSIPEFIEDFEEALKISPEDQGKQTLKYQWGQASDFGKLAMNSLIRRASDLYDATIKSLKKSQQFPSEKSKALAMGELLSGFLGLLKSVFSLIPSKSEQAKIMKPAMGETLLFPQYLKKLESGTRYEFGYESVNGSIGFNNLLHYLKTGKRKKCFSFQANGAPNPIGEQEAESKFKEMFPESPLGLAKQFSKQFEARPEFTVNTLIVGSKADLNFTVHWPNRLEEYFTAFHQNIEQVLKILNTKHGLDAQVLSHQGKEICHMLEGALETREISWLDFKEDQVMVGFKIPLQQHSASIEIRYQPGKPKQGAEIKVQAFGNDEHRRWDQMAAISSLLAFCKGNGFTDGLMPKIDYSDPTGVEFTIHFNSSIAKEDANLVLQAIAYLLKDLSMHAVDGPQELLETIQFGQKMDSMEDPAFPGIGEIDWHSLPEECYQQTLWLNDALLGMFSTENSPQLAAKIACNSLIGIARRKLSDYTRCDSGRLKKIAADAIKAMIKENNEACSHQIHQMMEDPDVQEFLDDVLQEIWPLL